MQRKLGFGKLSESKSLTARLLFALLGTLLLRFPFFSFQFGVANLQKKAIWANNFEVPCISDCRVYGELADGIDAVGHFKWTYFPIWPNIIRIFRNLIFPSMSGYSASVILSWIIGWLCGVLLLWFFDLYWKDDRKYFGFSKRAWTLLLIVSIFPHGHFWFQGYSEPLFLSVLLCGLLALASNHFPLAGLLIGFSAIVRPQGVWLPPLWTGLMGWLAICGKLSWRRSVFSIVLSGIGGLVLLVWYWKGTGDPFYYYKIQANGGYGRSFSFLGGIWNHHPRWDTAVLYLYLSLVGSVKLIRTGNLLSKTIGWFSLAFTEVPLFFGGFYSYVRFLSVSLGMFVFLTDEAEKSRFRELLIVVFFITKLAIQVYKSGYHEWVG